MQQSSGYLPKESEQSVLNKSIMRTIWAEYTLFKALHPEPHKVVDIFTNDPIFYQASKDRFDFKLNCLHPGQLSVRKCLNHILFLVLLKNQILVRQLLHLSMIDSIGAQKYFMKH